MNNHWDIAENIACISMSSVIVLYNIIIIYISVEFEICAGCFIYLFIYLLIYFMYSCFRFFFVFFWFFFLSFFPPNCNLYRATPRQKWYISRKKRPSSHCTLAWSVQDICCSLSWTSVYRLCEKKRKTLSRHHGCASDRNPYMTL